MLALLCTWSSTAAQGSRPLLRTGDRAPELKPLKWIKGGPAKHGKEKITVVELGATWCTPCVALIPELTALADAYKDQVSVVSVFVMEPDTDPPGTVNPSYVKRVEKFVAKYGDKITYNVAVDDQEETIQLAWLKASGMPGIPCTFLVDGNGQIVWIGSNPRELARQVELLIQGAQNSQREPEVQTIKAPAEKVYNPLQVLKDHGQAEDVLYFSMLSAYEGQTGTRTFPYVTSFKWADDDETKARRGKVEVLGGSLRVLYYLAYGDTLSNVPPHRVLSTGAFIDTLTHPHQKRSYGRYWYRPILEVRDTTVFESDRESLQNLFNYTLKLPAGMATAKALQEVMRQDLGRCFDYVVSVEERMMPCWRVTVSEEGKEKLKTRTPGQKYRSTQDPEGNYTRWNAEVRDIIFQLEIRYGYSATGNRLTYRADRQPPFIDATGITGEIDYTYDHKTMERINSENKLRNTFDDYRHVLEALGFKLERGYKKMKVVVIRDRV